MASKESSRTSGRRSSKRRRQKKSAPVALIVVIAVIVILAVAAAVVFIGFGDQLFGEKEYYDPAAVTGTYHENGYEDTIQEGAIFPLVHTQITVNASTGEAVIGFENVAANPYDLQLTLMEGGKVIFSTGVIQPGQYVESAVFEEVPTTGTHAVVARFLAYDRESHKAVGKADYPESVSLIVE